MQLINLLFKQPLAKALWVQPSGHWISGELALVSRSPGVILSGRGILERCANRSPFQRS